MTPFISNERSISATTPSPSSLLYAFYLITRCVFYFDILYLTHRKRKSWDRAHLPACANIHACDTHFKVHASVRLYARTYDMTTCVTFIAAHTVRAIMLGRRKRHGRKISLSTDVSEDPGNWI